MYGIAKLGEEEEQVEGQVIIMGAAGSLSVCLLLSIIIIIVNGVKTHFLEEVERDEKRAPMFLAGAIFQRRKLVIDATRCDIVVVVIVVVVVIPSGMGSRPGIAMIMTVWAATDFLSQRRLEFRESATPP